MILQALEWLGVPGQIVMLVIVIGAVLQGRRMLILGSTVGLWFEIVLAVVAIVGVGISEVVPGHSVTIDHRQIAQFLEHVFRRFTAMIMAPTEGLE
jgi:hypothetical protein